MEAIDAFLDGVARHDERVSQEYDDHPEESDGVMARYQAMSVEEKAIWRGKAVQRLQGLGMTKIDNGSEVNERLIEAEILLIINHSREEPVE